MPLQTIEPRRLYRQIAGQLRRLIDSGEFPAGSRLPPERDLAAQLGVSRPSVREALIALEVEGRVEVRMGSGIYVARPAPAPAGRPRSATAAAEADGPLETLRARQLIEPELAALAARQATPALRRELRQTLAQMRREIAAGRLPSSQDRQFHTLLAAAAGNAVLARIVGELHDERRNPLFVQLVSHFESPASWSLALQEHEQVLAAVDDGAVARARAAMRRHLARSHDRFTATWARR